MLRLRNVFGLITLMVVAATLYTGCSDTDSVTSPRLNIDSEVEEYFPLDEGFQSIYSVATPTGGSWTMQFEMGEEVSFQGGTAVPWHSYSSETGYNTCYLVAGDSSLYYYSSSTAAGEKILKAPLSAGTSWTRYEDDDTTSIITGYDDYGDDADSTAGDDDPPSLVAFPVMGSTEMTILGTESITLENGDHFSHALKVVGETFSRDEYDYFWFVGRVGLVKWAKGVSGDDIDQADETGELVTYGF